MRKVRSDWPVEFKMFLGYLIELLFHADYHQAASSLSINILIRIDRQFPSGTNTIDEIKEFAPFSTN